MITTHHLTPDDWADALAGDERAAVHLAACPVCRAELAGLQRLMADARDAGEVPEPSPVFWDSLSARVRAAVDDAPVPTRWWTAYWRPAVAMASVLVTVGLVLAGQPTRRLAGVPVPEAAVADDAEPIVVWSLIEQVVAPMPIDAVAEAGVLPGEDITAGAIEDLTPAERDTLLRLLRAELSGASH